MKKRLYQNAIISTPILGLIGAIPSYIVDKKEIDFFFTIWILLTVFIFIIWNVNIVLISKFNNTNTFKRYFCSYLIVIFIQFSSVFVLPDFDFKHQEYSFLLPFIGGIAINTIIIIISNSILFQFQKETAELENEQLKVFNLEAQKQMLLQQLQPHFLFNTLSTLKSLISENPNIAEDYVIKLSDFLRYSIQAKKKEIVSLEDELKFAKDYIDLQKVRFGDALHFDIDISTLNFDKKIPVYAIQALVENAIKHNSFTDKKPLYITVSAVDNKIKVQNNKVSKTLVLPSGTGLENLNLRYKMIANSEIEIIESDENFAVTLNLL
jgi:two-component system, LytTR family, sensor kinase